MPQGKRAYTFNASGLDGCVYQLKQGDHVDMLVSVPVDMPGSGHSEPSGTNVVATPDTLIQPRRTLEIPLVQDGVVISPITARATQVTNSSVMNGASTRNMRVEEIVVAVAPKEVAPLDEAKALKHRLTCVARSGLPEPAPTPAVSQPAGGASPSGTSDVAAAPGKTLPGKERAAAPDKSSPASGNAKPVNPAKAETSAKDRVAMDITPGLNPMADVRYMEVMIGAKRQFVLFNGPGNSPVVAAESDGSANADTTTTPAQRRRPRQRAERKRTRNRLRMERHHTKRTNRRGYVLVLFVMMFFGFMGLAALVIDIGFARLAQRQMQSATDTAALEGLRWQAASPAGSLVPRQQASQMVANLFTDSVDSSGGTVQYGAGPVVNFSGDVGPADLDAGQTITWPPPSPVYQPTTSSGTAGLELNPSNATEGDMVAGTYNLGQPSAEADDYTRADFSPALSGSSTGSAFLVRMRRTNNVYGLDQEPGISSSGPTLPVLFGRGSLMARSGSGSQLSAASGITVRATAIAGPQPAKTVGPLYTNSGGTLTAVAQLAPFAIRSDIWTQVSGGAAVTVNPLVAGSGATILDSQFRITLTAIGQPLVGSANDSTLSMGPQSSFVCADLCRFRQPAGDDHWFRLLQQLELHQRQSDAWPARRRRANWQSKRVAHDGLAVAGGTCCGGRYDAISGPCGLVQAVPALRAAGEPLHRSEYAVIIWVRLASEPASPR